jgi:flagellar protein FlaJ
MERENKLLIIAICLLGLISIVSLIFFKVEIFLEILIIGSIIIVTAYSVYRFIQFRKIKAYEEEFPNFLRDLAQTQYTGSTLIQGFEQLTKIDYGPLSREIKKINDQLSWNIPLENALENFRKKMKKSKTISRSVAIIIQAYKSGSKVEDIMDSLATNIEQITSVQKEKRTLMGQQVTMLYAIFIIFLVISIALIKFLVPMIQSQSSEGVANFAGIANINPNPCASCINVNDFSCIGCKIFFSISSIFGFGDPSSPAAYYKSVFLSMIIIQGFLGGLIAGQIGSDSVVAGVKHSLIMVVVGLVIFLSSSIIGII